MSAARTGYSRGAAPTEREERILRESVIAMRYCCVTIPSGAYLVVWFAAMAMNRAG
jgi:hypothetical protein